MPGAGKYGRRDRTVADEAGFKGLGTAVHKGREELGLTDHQLAYRAELSITTLRAIERGEQDTTWGNMRRLAKALETPLDELLDRGIDLAPGPGGDELREDRANPRWG